MLIEYKIVIVCCSFGKLLLECQSIEEDVPLEEEHRMKYSFDDFAPLVFSKGVKQCFMTK